MKINRESLLTDLNLVKAGLSPREFIEQSSCFVFQDGMVMTFNDEVSCRKQVNLDFVGAVQAPSLLGILEKMDDPELDVQENDKGELEFSGKRKRFGVVRDAEIFLPVDRVEQPEKWFNIPPGLAEAISLVQHCVSKDESKFLLTCVHLTPEHIEACDNMQMMRCLVKTGLKSNVLVRGSSLAHLTELAMDKIALTKSWIHFKNQAGLVFSCRRYAEDYPDLAPALKFRGSPIVLPKGLAEASDRAAVFASDKSGEPLVKIKLAPGKIWLSGEGLTGWYREVKGVAYDGPLMEFSISPSLLRHVSEHYSDAELNQDKLKVVGGSWEYVTVLGQNAEEQAEEEEKPPAKGKRKSKSAEDEEPAE